LSLAAPSKTTLQHKRATLNSQITQVRKKLRSERTRAQQTKRQLRGVENRLVVYRGQLQVAKVRFERSKVELHRATVALKQAKEEYADSQQAAGERIAALYKRGDDGYLHLLLSSEDFGDFLQRSQLAKFMLEQDRKVLEQLRERKTKVEQYQERVKTKTAEVAAWKQRVAVVHNRTWAERQQVATTLTISRKTMYSMEAELAALERDSAAVESMLRSMQSSAAGKRRYSQYRGPVSGLPVRGRITSPYGYRTHPVLGGRRLHTGVDIAAPTGTPIYAVGNGEVIYAGWRGGYGNTVIVDHGGGRATLYAHMSSIGARVGQSVSKGQVIGRVGSTGISTGPHVHFELRINGRPVNPL
jgi:murein DD-endopeptidase MepM/ murein hydrolase activator NlpD